MSLYIPRAGKITGKYNHTAEEHDFRMVEIRRRARRDDATPPPNEFTRCRVELAGRPTLSGAKKGKIPKAIIDIRSGEQWPSAAECLQAIGIEYTSQDIYAACVDNRFTISRYIGARELRYVKDHEAAREQALQPVKMTARQVSRPVVKRRVKQKVMAS